MTNEPFLRFRLEGDRQSLVVGSGLGILGARSRGSRVPLGEVCGIEQSTDQLVRPGRAWLTCASCKATLTTLPFNDYQFDVVYCRYLLEHAPSRARVLTEIHRVLKPGGRALAQENNNDVNMHDPPCPQFDYVWRQFGSCSSVWAATVSSAASSRSVFTKPVSPRRAKHSAGNPLPGCVHVPTVGRNLIGNVTARREALRHRTSHTHRDRRRCCRAACLACHPRRRGLLLLEPGVRLVNSARRVETHCGSREARPFFTSSLMQFLPRYRLPDCLCKGNAIYLTLALPTSRQWRPTLGTWVSQT